MAVCRLSSPHSRRRPSTMATKPTPNPAIMSMDSAERKATRRVRMVAERTPSVAAATSRRPWPSRPKARRVGKPLDELEEAAGQRPEPAPLALGAPGRLAPEVDHRDRHGDHQRHDHDEGQPVLRGHPGQQEDGDDGGRRGLREVAGVVGVERAQPPGGGERELARPLAGQPAGAEVEGVAQQLAAQVGPRRGRPPVRPTGRPQPCSTARATMATPTRTSGRPHVAQRRVVQQRAVDGMGQGHRLDDDGHGAQRRRRTSATAGDPAQAGHPGRELRVDQAGAAGGRGGGAHRLNVVSFTSTARPMSALGDGEAGGTASSQVAAVRTPSARSATMAVRTGSRPGRRRRR